MMKKAIIVAFVLALLAAGGWRALPVYRAHKEKRFAAQAGNAWLQKEHRKALLSARQALVLNSNNLVATRVMADLADLSRSPQAIVWRRRIAEIDPSLENQAALVLCASRYEQPPFALASRLFKELAALDGASNTIPFQLVGAQLALKQNRIADAENHFEQAIRLEPTNDLHRLNLAVVRLESKNAAVSAQARGELERLQSVPPWNALALRSLVVHHASRKQFDEAERYSALLLRATNAMFGDKLEHLTILHGAKSPAFSHFLDTTRREAATNTLYASDLVTRMTALGLAAEAIAWIKTLPPAAQNELPLPVAVADSYVATKQWREMEQALVRQQWREREFLRKALLAYAVRMQEVETVAMTHWDEAVRLASDRPELTLMLAQLSSNWRWTNETETLLWRAAKQFPQERWPLESLQGNYARLRRTSGLFDVWTVMLDRQPTNAVVQNNWANLAFLLQTNVAKAHQLARQVYERNTNNFAFVSTYAWSLHLQGKTTEALEVIETLKTPELEHPSVASYYGALLAASGQSDKARHYLAKAENAPILPEELNLITDARKRL
jgi:tetratricopeptide (TPR) repeat protein